MSTPKYGKYRNYMSKHLKFGDFLEDAGKMLANTVATPVETIAGRNFYDPNFKGQAFQEINNVTQGVVAGATDVAGTMLAGPAYGLGKQVVQAGVNAADPNQALENTRDENLGLPTYNVGKGLSSLGSFGSNFVGGTGQVKPMKNGGPLKERVGPLAKIEDSYVPMDYNRPYYLDEEGKKRSEYKTTVGTDQGEYVIPTVIDGKQLSEDEAYEYFLNTREHMGGPFNNTADAERASRLRTSMYNNPGALAYGGKKANGGYMNQALTEYNSGGTHEQNPLGGIQVGDNASVEEGETQNNKSEYIYSDRLTIDKDLADEFSLPKYAVGKTFAEYSKRINKLNPRKQDRFDKATNEAMLNRLTEAQEAYKMTNFVDDYEGILQKKYGGQKQMFAGGFSDGDPLKQMQDLYKTKPFQFYVPGINPEKGLMPSQPMLQTPVGLETVYKSNSEAPVYEPSITPNFKQYGVSDLNTEIGNMPSGEIADLPSLQEPVKNYGPLTEDVNISPVYDYMRAVPTLTNAIRGLNHDELDFKNYKVNTKVTAPNYNIDPLLDANRSGYAGALGKIREASAGSGGTYLGNLSTMYGAKAKADAGAYNTKENTENQLDFQAQGMNLDTDKYNSQTRFQVDDWNMRSKEMAKNMLGEAATNVGQYGDAKAQEAFMQAYVNSISPNYKYNFTKKLRNKKK